jgi:inhibitor of KinA sporulation pathway (predicted exonuclease)
LAERGSLEFRRGAADLHRLVRESGSAFVIYDLEYTSWEGAEARGWSGPGEFREIVQIGAVKLAGLSEQLELESLDILVKPRLSPTLSEYFIELTGITQADVETKGLPFEEALRCFAGFAAGCKALSNGGDDEVLATNCSLHGLEFPFQPGALVNIAQTLRETLSHDVTVRSCDLPAWLGLASPGHAHQALSDARAIAIALRYVLQD